jgi:hypothetical protein
VDVNLRHGSKYGTAGAANSGWISSAARSAELAPSRLNTNLLRDGRMCSSAHG